eukprot:GEMP01000045.1.p1 GENE.GEMP01000045.1~~GEMP01000045.1.p1  ORF type:complete len:3312 (+),score=740.25 GEMP01000045.1:2269-12204(+)
MRMSTDFLEKSSTIFRNCTISSFVKMKYNRYQDVLKMDVTPFDDVEELRASFAATAKLWRGIDQWDKLTDTWNNMQFRSIDVEEIQKEVQVYHKMAAQCQKQFPDNPVVPIFFEHVMDLKRLLPIVVALRNSALKPRHWLVIETEFLGKELHLDDPNFTMGSLLDMQINDYVEGIQELSSTASGEQSLEFMLDKVKKTWEELEFIVNNYKDSKDVFILGAPDEIITQLEDSLVIVSTILASRYVAPLRDEVEEWQKSLMVFQETLDEWLQVQRNWIYLEAIFGAVDIRKQLPMESAKFIEMDTEWRQIMKETKDYAVAIVAGTKPGRMELFRTFNETLDLIQKSLEDYLQSKRVSFPRFFFLANDELLEILAKARRPQAVQPHLRKCFDNLVLLQFAKGDKSTEILGMYSAEKEMVPFYKPLKARGNVEKWLLEVEEYMCKTIHSVIKKGCRDYPDMVRAKWVLQKEAQVVATAGMIMWCVETEEVWERGGGPNELQRFYIKNVQQLTELTHLVRGKLTSIQRKSIVALVTQDVHNRDIVETLHELKVMDPKTFKWQQQLRYYWDVEEDDCIVRQVDAKLRYGHEYQGATSRLVITPLTDRCWMTITGALHIKLGAAPAGPAGTGKTESTKDLAKGIGRQCVVFNCSDQIDYKMMAKLYSGVVTTGAWTCLDEFNRISIEVLSVVAQQLNVIRTALLKDASEFFFEGNSLKLRPTCAVCITMNPGYAGRTELPDNLKVLFRPMSMMVPDYTLIAEIMLFAEGFENAKKLAGKFAKLFKLSSEQLSPQDHYDFGMRAVKSVLVMAGNLKRESADLDEDVLLIRAMRDSNVPKFLADDLPLFFAIVSDLFPGVEVPYINYGELETSVQLVMVREGYQKHASLVGKVIQLYETLQVRFGVTLVGHTLGGKSVCFRTLAGALTYLREQSDASNDPARMNNPDDDFHKVVINVLNPKCISMGELYGEFNALTQEWTDGLASSLFRSAVEDETDDQKWTMFDGPIDALWIENMNTVLDDNMTLCLASGERIKLKWDMRVLFEVQDLAVASPASVSRLGMVYLNSEELGWRPLFQTWIGTLPAEPFANPTIRKLITSYFDTYVDVGLQWRQDNYAMEPVSTVDTQRVIALCNLFAALFNSKAATRNGCVSQDADPVGNKPMDLNNLDISQLEALLLPAFAFAFGWTFGATLEARARTAFFTWMQDVLFDVKIQFPMGKGIDDVFLDLTKGPMYQTWDALIPKFTFKPEASYFELLVPTSETIRYAYVLDKMLSAERSCFLTGSTGVGKSVVISNLMSRMKEMANISPINITLSAQTQADTTQIFVESKLDKKRKTLLGPPQNKSAVIYVDDVNMPTTEEFGAQPPIELLRQLQDLRGFYDRKKLFWKDVEGTTLLLSAAPPGGGRSVLSMRFQRHSMMLCMLNTSEDSVTFIFSNILQAFLLKFKPEVQMFSSSCVGATFEIYERISQELLPTPKRAHYTFNLRDVSKVFQGILMVKSANVGDPEAFCRLWVHEVSRVFYDRLINADDKTWFKEAVMRPIQKRFRLDWTPDRVFGTPLLWGDYLRPEARVYEEIRDLDKMKRTMEDYNDDYNLSNPTTMNLVFFSDCLDHINRIGRVLRQPRGHLVLVGVGGSGRTSLARLCAHFMDMGRIEIEMTKGYNTQNFREDEKRIISRSGKFIEQHTMFLFNETQIVSETFLEDINNILNAGEVPNLFLHEDIEDAISYVREDARNMNISDTRDALWAYFVERVRTHLHVVLAMSPIGSTFRVRIRMFPSIVNCSTIDWFDPWPDDALMEVAKHFFDDFDSINDEQRALLAQECVCVHQGVIHFASLYLARLKRHVYVTPKSYLDLIALFGGMLEEKRDEKTRARHRLATGVDKINEANTVVATLSGQIEAMQPVIEQKMEDAKLLIPTVREERAKAELIKAKVEADEKVIRKQAVDVRAVQEDAQKDLDVAMPALEAALKALDSLDKKDVTEIRSFTKPPPLVMMTMEAVCVLMGEKTDWDSAKKVLGDLQFIQKLKVYDKDNIAPNVLRRLDKYVAKPEYQPDVVGKQSSAAKSLCMWTHAMDTYSKVAKEVEPKKKKLEEMTESLNEANATLKNKQEELARNEKEVANLQKKLRDTENERDKLIAEQQLCKERMTRAGILTEGLADEAVRWKAMVEKKNEELINLAGDVFLSAAAVSYYGPFSGDYRSDIVATWLAKAQELGLCCDPEYDLRHVLGDPIVMRQWRMDGLPSDSVSTCNGILFTRARRWPLMIDPQAQATKWIKKRGGDKLEILKLIHPKMLLILEGCVRTGTELLVEDIMETLDPALDPVLQKAVFDNAGRPCIRIGDNDVDYDSNFSVCFTTKMPNPHYFPEVAIKVTIINFTITPPNLEEQLLNHVVEHEIPAVVEKKTTLMIELADAAKMLNKIESNILQSLSESTGNILDDKALINMLSESKAKSNEINDQVLEAEKTAAIIETRCQEYAPVAARGSILYFVVADLASIDPMYQFSLSYFSNLFNNTIHESPMSDILQERLLTLIDKVTYTVFLDVTRGLFEKHKLIFSFLICSQIHRRTNLITQDKWNLLLRGLPSLFDAAERPAMPVDGFLLEKQWSFLYGVQVSLGGARCVPLCSHIVEHAKMWQDWAAASCKPNLPLDFDEAYDLSVFDKLLIVKVLCPENVIFGVEQYVEKSIGDAFVHFRVAKMEDVYASSRPETSIIFVLSQGADPTQMLYRFAREMGMEQSLGVISLGQGQGPRAQKMIEESAKKGTWVLLQNCHLARSWMPTLERIVSCLDDARAASGGSTVSKHFRLFLTSMPCSYFPTLVLQNGVKLTNEPPRGVRSNVLRSLVTLTDSVLHACDQRQVWSRIQFGLKVFHAVIQERRKFGPLGWNTKYEFNDSDLETSSTNAINNLNLEVDGPVPWATLLFVIGQINYGGRVTDDWDRRLLMEILKKFITPNIIDDSGYTFSASGIYHVPSNIDDMEANDYVAFVENWPLSEMPELFGMDDNANILFQQQESDFILSSVLSIQPREVTETGGLKPEEAVLELARDILGKLAGCTCIDVSTPHAATFHVTPETGIMISLGTCLKQEVLRFNKLLHVVITSLEDVEKAINGLIVMTADLDLLFTSLQNNQIPLMWEKVSYPSLMRLGSYVEDLIQRVGFFQDWVHNSMPPAFCLSAFFFPQGFLTAVLQQTSRTYSIPVDVLGFEFSVMDFMDPADVETTPEEGCMIYGLFMDACRWNFEDMVLADQNPGIMYVPSPLIHFLPAQNYMPDPAQYSCPLYKTGVRAGTLSTTGHSTNFVIAIELDSLVDPGYWVLRSAALLTMLSD